MNYNNKDYSCKRTAQTAPRTYLYDGSSSLVGVHTGRFLDESVPLFPLGATRATIRLHEGLLDVAYVPKTHTLLVQPSKHVDLVRLTSARALRCFTKNALPVR